MSITRFAGSALGLTIALTLCVTTTARATAMRGELTAASLRAAALSDSVQWLNQRFANFRNGSVFGQSGFHVGVGRQHHAGRG